MAKAALSSIGGAVTLPGDVYSGRVDPRSDEAVERAFDLGTLATPAAPRMRAGAPAPAPPPVIREADDLGVQLTAGQRTGNPSLLSREDAMLGGGVGPRAQEVAQAARARQTDQIFSAQDMIGDTAGRGRVQLERPSEAGGVVSDALRDVANTARQGFKRQYDDAFSGEGVMRPEFFQGRGAAAADDFGAPLSQRIAKALVDRDEPVIIDEVVTPIAARALKALDDVSSLKLGAIGQPEAGDVVTGVTLRGVDQARRKLVSFYKASRANPADARAVQSVISTFDDQVERAVAGGLFSGDERFLDMLRGARKSYTNYQRTFKPQGQGDDVGRAVQAIVERDATPEQVANYLYGASKVGSTGLSVRLSGRLKSVLGEESAEWAAIRQGAWQKITGVAEGRTPMGPQKMSERIFEFTNGEGRSLATRLFSGEELEQMRRFGRVLKATTAKAGTTNPSNSGNRMAALSREAFATIASMLGASASGPAGAAGGYMAGRTLTGIGDMRAASQARQLFSGQEPMSIARRLSPAFPPIRERLALPAGAAAAGQVGPAASGR
ncbi:MAG: hypothetical protein EA385_10650 [Salinarimonadaceae bacterium]|nr:MAG: hypothetical protein EA385_10650 [Salinarimonadaceae bacterium]